MFLSILLPAYNKKINKQRNENSAKSVETRFKSNYNRIAL